MKGWAKPLRRSQIFDDGQYDIIGNVDSYRKCINLVEQGTHKFVFVDKEQGKIAGRNCFYFPIVWWYTVEMKFKKFKCFIQFSYAFSVLSFSHFHHSLALIFFTTIPNNCSTLMCVCVLEYWSSCIRLWKAIKTNKTQTLLCTEWMLFVQRKMNIIIQCNSTNVRADF